MAFSGSELELTTVKSNATKKFKDQEVLRTKLEEYALERKLLDQFDPNEPYSR